MTTSGFLAVQCTHRHHLGKLQQEAELNSLQQVKVEALAFILNRDICVALFELVNGGESLANGFFGTEHLHIGFHHTLQLGADSANLFGALPVTNTIEHRESAIGSVVRNRHEICGCGVFCGAAASTLTKHVNVQK